MAKWQKVYLHRQTAEATTSRQNTILVDLPEKDFLSQILVKVYTVNPAYSTPLLPVMHFIKKLEVVDGSDVLFSLSGAETQAISFFRGRTMPCAERCDWENTDTYDLFYIRFNRFPGDTKYLLNLGKLSNPQLKITYDNTVVLVEGCTYTVNTTTPTVRYTVVCDILRGTPPNNYTGKFISARDVFTYVSPAAGTEYIDIPRTDPIFGIAVRAAYYAHSMSEDLNRVRLNINNQEWIPFDIYYDEMKMLHEEWFQPKAIVEERIDTYYQVRYDSGLGEAEYYQPIVKGVCPDILNIQSNTGGWIRLGYVVGSTGASDTTARYSVCYFMTGLFPQHTAYLPMSVVTDTPEETLDAPSCANILLEITSVGASGSCQPSVIVDVVRDEGR
jgi:hypothetical protein